jgi:mutator protein MutT
MKERNKAVPAAYLVLVNAEGRVLLMRRANTGYCDGQYAFCAGHVDAGELPVQALLREAVEELNIRILPEDAKLIHTMYRTKHDETGDRIDLFFKVTKWEGEPTNAEPHKCDDIAWFAVDQLPESMMHHDRLVLGFMAKNQAYSELSLKELQGKE